MNLSVIIAITVIGAIALVLIFIPESRKLLKGFVRMFVKDMATTPEGAEAIYDEKINDAQDSYRKADDAYKSASGRLSEAQKNLEHLKTRKAKVEAECEAFVRAKDIDSAQLKSEERSEIIADIGRQEELIKAFTVAAAAAKEAFTACESRLKKLQKEKKDVVENMKVKQQLKETYDEMDDLKAVTPTDKLLDSVREKNKDLNTVVEGSRIVHESKTSTKLQRVEEKARKVQSDDYLAGLMKKYK